MSKIYKSMKDYSKGGMSRREFLKSAAAVGLTTPAVVAFLQGCTPQAPAGTGEEGQASADLSGFTQAQAQAAPLVFNAWAYKPEVVEAFQRDFEEQYGEAMSFEVIPGDYTSIMLNKMIAGSALDCLYTKAQGTKMLEAGWIHDLSDLDNIDEIKAATLPAQWEAQSYKGQVFGLPYFNSMKCCLHYNRVRTEEAGIGADSLPTTWDEVYDIASRLKRDGFAEYPIVMWWLPNPDYVVDNFIAECLSRGDLLWDTEFNAVFDENSGAADTLNAWQRLWSEELVPPDCMAGGDLLELFASGDPVFNTGQSYQMKDLNDPERFGIAGNVMMVPYAGQAWGFLDYGLYSIAARPEEDVQRLERRKRWINFMGYKDKNGNFLVAKEWVKQANLGTGYPEIYDDPEVIEAYQSWMPEYPLLRETMAENEEHVVIANGWHAVWYPEWSVKAVEVLPQVITGDMGVSEALRTLRETWDSLQATYT